MSPLAHSASVRQPTLVSTVPVVERGFYGIMPACKNGCQGTQLLRKKLCF